MMPALVVSTITPNYGQKLRPGSHFKVAELVGGKFAQKMHHTISCRLVRHFSALCKPVISSRDMCEPDETAAAWRSRSRCRRGAGRSAAR